MEDFVELGSTYNPLYEKLVDNVDGDHEELIGLVAYALYKRSKRSWAAAINSKEQRKPTEIELGLYVATWTQDRLDGLKEQAAGTLAQFAGAVVDTEESRILRDALKGSFWRAVWPAVTAALIYTIILIVAAVILHRTGIDALDILHRETGK